MQQTTAGGFPLGFRRGGGDWQRDLGDLITFATDNRFSFLDLGPSPAGEVLQVLQSGLGVGSVDLKRWKDMVSGDADRQRSAIDENVAHVRSIARCGVRLFLAVIAPDDPALPRIQNFDLAVKAYGQLATETADTGARILFEGPPGRPPWFATLACTPADCRAFFAAVGQRFGQPAADMLGLNFDPSHLVRMGIDPVRFLHEFFPRIHHAHAKDALILPEGLYEHGSLQQATLAPPQGSVQYFWRYTIPGRGCAPWSRLISILRDRGYTGGLSIELEDEEFTGSKVAEQAGLLAARDFLIAC